MSGGSATGDAKLAVEANGGKKGGKKGGGKKGSPQGKPENKPLDGKGNSGADSKESSKTTAKEDQPSVKSEKVETAKEPSEGNGGKEELMSEVTSLLRSLRVQGGEPQIRMIEVRSINEVETGAHTLLDGGATHCLRQCRDQREWDEASAVNVKLAAGEMKMRQHPVTMTLLMKEPVQAIVPVSKLTECGYAINWTRDHCRVEHSAAGRVPLEMSQGCPTVNKEWGERLMREIEEMEMKKAKLRAILCCDMLAETEHEKKVAELQSLYPDVPLRVLERIPGYKNWCAEQLPFNRRFRRRVERSKAVIVSMCSGPDKKR